MRFDLIGNSAITIRDYDTIVHEGKLVPELMQGGFPTNCLPWWLALCGYLQFFHTLVSGSTVRKKLESILSV
jgi:hypothetical protein